MRSKPLEIAGYALLYPHTIFEDGRLFNEHTKRWVKGTTVTKLNRYSHFHLSLKGEPRKKHGKWQYPSKFFKAHRVVAENFLEPPQPGQTEVNHKDGNRRNNAAWNLEWCSHQHNMLEAYRIGIKTNRGEKGPNHRLKTPPGDQNQRADQRRPEQSGHLGAAGASARYYQCHQEHP